MTMDFKDIEQIKKSGSTANLVESYKFAVEPN
jgi:hypothetical protein